MKGLRRSRSGALAVYSAALFDLRREAFVAAASLAVGGIIEGVALASLLPVISSGVSGGRSRFAIGPLQHWTNHQIAVLALIAFVVLGLLSALLNLVGQRRLIRLRSDAEARFKISLVDAVLGMNWSAFLTMRGGDISNALLAEASQCANAVQTAVVVVSGTITSAVFIALSLLISWTLSLGVGLFGALFVLGFRRAIRGAADRTRELGAVAEAAGVDVNEIFGNLKYVRASGFTGVARRTLAQTFNRIADLYYRAQRVGVDSTAAYQTLGLILIGAVLVDAIGSTASIAKALVFLGIFYRLAPRLQMVSTQYVLAVSYVPWLERFEQRRSKAAQADEKHLGTLPPGFNSQIVFREVGFSYPASTRPVFERLSLSIPHGSTVAVIGESGAGKTTLLDLLCGLLRPTSGQILVDGIDLVSIESEAWRSRLGMVTQDPPVLHATVAENIAWGYEDPDRERVAQCAELADAAEFIAELPDGFDTLVGERGGKLSGGQRQRLALARALYREPWLLVLDEPTSALDLEAERRVIDSLKRLKDSYTTLVVTHRLALARHADAIVVLAGGRAAECGSWDELMGKRSGILRRMASNQGIRGRRSAPAM